MTAISPPSEEELASRWLAPKDFPEVLAIEAKTFRGGWKPDAFDKHVEEMVSKDTQKELTKKILRPLYEARGYNYDRLSAGMRSDENEHKIVKREIFKDTLPRRNGWHLKEHVVVHLLDCIGRVVTGKDASGNERVLGFIYYLLQDTGIEILHMRVDPGYKDPHAVRDKMLQVVFDKLPAKEGRTDLSILIPGDDTEMQGDIYKFMQDYVGKKGHVKPSQEVQNPFYDDEVDGVHICCSILPIGQSVTPSRTHASSWENRVSDYWKNSRSSDNNIN